MLKLKKIKLFSYFNAISSVIANYLIFTTVIFSVILSKNEILNHSSGLFAVFFEKIVYPFMQFSILGYTILVIINIILSVCDKTHYDETDVNSTYFLNIILCIVFIGVVLLAGFVSFIYGYQNNLLLKS